MAEHPTEHAFLAAFDDYADALFRHASLRLSNRDLARDLTQDTFIKAWEYVREGNAVREWRSFLYRVLNNLIVDEYRRTKPVSLDQLAEENPVGAEALVAGPGRREREEALDETRALDAIRALIRELPEPHGSALVLRYIDGFSPKEIARTLEISENAASVRIHRATIHLRSLCEARHIL